MTYNVQKAIETYGGVEQVLKYIYTEGPNQISLHQEIGLSSSSSRLSNPVYKRLYKLLGITELPYPKVSQEVRKFYLALDRHMPNYWEDAYIVSFLYSRLQNASINIAESRARTVINFPRHPSSNKDSGQVKGHIIAWELYNRQYVPENHWVIPIDNDYLNLEESNLVLVNTTEYKSKRFSGTGNPSFKHGNNLRPKLGGWNLISRTKRILDGKCKICGCTEDLVVHHIINYHLFKEPIEAHQLVNLMTLCRSCHTNVHNNKISIKKDLIAEMRYSKLLELLENLKSQVPDSLMETYRDVEKQLGLTDNQQPST